MRLTIQNLANEEQIFNVEIDNEGTVEDVKIFISVETNIPIEE